MNAVKLAHQASDFILKNERAREKADEKKASWWTFAHEPKNKKSNAVILAYILILQQERKR